jgi:hypothetical protein
MRALADQAAAFGDVRYVQGRVPQWVVPPPWRDWRIFYFTMTPAPKFAGLRHSQIQQVYQKLRRFQHMPMLSET